MALRREDNDETVAVSEEASFCSSSSFSTDRFRKSSMSFLSFEESPPLDSIDVDNARPALSASLQLIKARGDNMLRDVCDALNNSTQESLIVNACNSSLQSEFSFLLEEAQVLLDNMGKGGDCPLTMITSWRVSLALVRVDAYLEAIETALKCADRDKLDTALLSVASSISTQLKSSPDEEKFDEANHVALRVSPWNMATLAFDLSVGNPVKHMLTPQDDGLPLNLDVKSILEIKAKDIYDGSCFSYSACKVRIERSVHEVVACRAGAGTVGEATVQIRVSPILNTNGASVKSARSWEMDKEEVMPLHVKEARTVQMNAFPPSPKTTVDLYVSSNHGESDTTITLRFPTYKTLNDVTPEVRIELVMG